MPTNSDLKRWYKVFNIKEHDFVRYDDMFRILCNDAVSDDEAVNLGQMNEAIKKAIQEHVYNINIENGDGEYSLQQKTSDKSNRALAYLSKACGSQSIVKPNDSDKNATGEGSCANGYDIQIDGAKYAYAGGQHVRVEKDANNSFAYGDNIVVKADSQAVFGKYNAADDVSLFMIGAGTDEEHRKTIMRALNNGQVLFSEAPVNLEAPIRLKDFTIDYYPASKVETAKLALKANDFTEDGTIAAFLNNKADKRTGNNIVYSTDAKGEQSQLSYSADAVANTIAQRTITGQLKAADGTADDDLATIKQLNIVKQGNYSNITNIDLNTDNTTVEYNAASGIAVNATGTITHENGSTEQPTAMFKVPIAAGDGIAIDKAQNEEKISIKVDGKVTKTPDSIAKRDNEGHVKTADATSDEDATSYGQHKALRTYTDAELLKKLDKTGGTITGNLIVSGNLSVSGEASIIESTTLKVADKLIYVAKDNTSALTSPAGLITPKYDGTNDGGIVYDNSGTAYVGDIKLDSNGNVDVNNSDLQPIATRDNYSNFTNGHKVKVEVDSLQKSVKFVDGGKDDGINTLTDINLTLGDTTVQYDTTDGIQINSTARFTAQGTNHDAMMDLDIPVVGKNGIVIDKAADSEKIEVKVDNSKIFNVNIASLGSSSNYNRIPYLPKHATLLPESKNYLLYVDDDGSADVGDIPSYVSSSAGDTIVGYGGGVLITNTPTKPYQAANKKYADDGFVAKVTTSTQDIRVYGLYADGTQAVFPTSQNVPELEHIAQYTTGGNIRTNTPIDNLDCANKKYVDNGFVAKVDISENFVKVFTIPNAASTGTLTADVKEKLCNPDGHNYYVFDDTSQMILKYSFNADDEIIQYKAIYLQNDKAYEITMQILPSNGSWRRSQTVLNGATANPTLTGTEAELTGLKVGGTNYKIPGKLSDAQLEAVNSGITAGKVSTYDGYQSQISDKYTKPSGGIPETDLASEVQASLEKADSALQSHQSITTGSVNGTISVGGTNVSVKGLGSLAYKNALTKSDVGLGNVDNTSDEAKPISTATQAALNGKVNTTRTVNGHALSSNVTITKSDVGLGSVVNAGQDSTPTANSTNYVTSGGVKSYVDTATSILRAYPVGAVYISVNSTNPGELFGGSWTQLKDRFLLGAGTTYPAGSMGGEATHTLTESEMPRHNHTLRIVGNGEVHQNVPATNTSWGYYQNIGDGINYTGGSLSHNNMPPYLTVYMWKRIS